MDRVSVSHDGMERDGTPECRARLEVAMDLLALSSAQLKGVIFSGPDDAVDTALTSLRVARVRFLSARADCREQCEAA